MKVLIASKTLNLIRMLSQSYTNLLAHIKRSAPIKMQWVRHFCYRQFTIWEMTWNIDLKPPQSRNSESFNEYIEKMVIEKQSISILMGSAGNFSAS